MSGPADRTILGCARFAADEAGCALDAIARIAATARPHELEPDEQAELDGAIVSVLRHVHWVREASVDIIAIAEKAEREHAS